jgi:hypothetical protein
MPFLALYLGAATVKLCSVSLANYVHGTGVHTESKNSSITSFCCATELAERYLRNATSRSFCSVILAIVSCPFTPAYDDHCSQFTPGLRQSHNMSTETPEKHVQFQSISPRLRIYTRDIIRCTILTLGFRTVASNLAHTTIVARNRTCFVDSLF